MGYGDTLMALGDARKRWLEDGVHSAIGDGIALTDLQGLDVGLPYIIRSQEEALMPGTSWIMSKPGLRPYINYAAMRSAAKAHGFIINKPSKLVSRLGRYIWNTAYKASPAEIVFTDAELELVDSWQQRGPFVVVEPFIKESAPTSKQFPIEKMKEIVKTLSEEVSVFQISPMNRPSLYDGIARINARSFRETLAYMRASSLYIGPEGGLHHGAAAVGTRAVVLFGGYIPPSVTGYDFHINLTGGTSRFCGVKHNCRHCASAFSNIRPADVIKEARTQLELEYAL